MLSPQICAVLATTVSVAVASPLSISKPKSLPFITGAGSIDTGIHPALHLLDLSAISRQLNGSARAHPFQGSRPNVAKRDVIGGENRFRYSDPDHFPFRAVGRINGPGFICSGALVGPSLVLTARHCAVNGGSYQFCPSFDNGQPNPTFGCANVIDKYVPSQPGEGDKCHWARDFAVVRLDKRYGDGLGYFGYSRPDQSRFGKQILNSGGYPGDKDGANNLYFQYGGAANRNEGQLSCSNYGPLLSDVDSAPGQSGSPIWVDDGYIWSVLAGGNNINTVGSGDKNTEDAIVFLRNAGG